MNSVIIVIVILIIYCYNIITTTITITIIFSIRFGELHRLTKSQQLPGPRSTGSFDYLSMHGP